MLSIQIFDSDAIKLWRVQFWYPSWINHLHIGIQIPNLLITVNPSSPYIAKSQAPTTLGVQRTISMERSSEGLAFGPTAPSNISMHGGKVVFYITIALLSVCMISLLMYGISYLRKMNTSKHRIKTPDHQFKNTGNSLYECVDFPNHMWTEFLSIIQYMLNYCTQHARHVGILHWLFQNV